MPVAILKVIRLEPPRTLATEDGRLSLRFRLPIPGVSRLRLVPER